MKSNMKVSLVVTLFNEEKDIQVFLTSLENLLVQPDEIIFIDGNSTDSTYKILRNFANSFKKTRVRVFRKKGNRSIGRNEGVLISSYPIIAFSDSGCLLEKNWIKEIIKPFESNSVEVVAGYYKGLAQNDFQKALIPYVLIMPDKINTKKFLPATRSMAILKKTFFALDGFDTRLSNNEDYAFSKKLERNKRKIVFAKKAIVFWIPRDSFKSAFIMFYRFALGDIESGIVRPKVLTVFLRYLLFFAVLILIVQSINFLWLFLSLLFFYITYILFKNRKYNKTMLQRMYSVLIQFTADFSVLSGSLVGLFKRKRV